MKLYFAPAAKTAHSIAVVWDKVFLEGKDVCYAVSLNGREVTRVTQTDYTFEDLEADTAYQISVAALGTSREENPHDPGTGLPGQEADDSQVYETAPPLLLRTRPEPVRIDVEDYGAVGDGKTLNTAAIQAAIDACPEDGMVCIPAGTYVSGALFLKSDMTLHVEEGARLLGSGNTADYPLLKKRCEGEEKLSYASLINTTSDGQTYHNISITGKGTIDGNGSVLLKKELEEGKGVRGSTVSIQYADGVYFKDVTIRHSAFWCVHLVYCSQVSMNRIQVYSKYDENGEKYEGIYNGDGIDPDSCRDVCIFHSHINSQDDCISVKSGRNREGRQVGIPSENIRISNCTFLSGFGVAMGSEMSGGVRHVLVQDCVFKDSFCLASIKSQRGRGGCVEDILYENCTLQNHDRTIPYTKWFKGVLYIDCYYGLDEDEPRSVREADEGTPVFRNITFRNIRGETDEGYAVYLVGLKESPLSGITLENVSLRGEYGMNIENAADITVTGLTVSARK